MNEREAYATAVQKPLMIIQQVEGEEIQPIVRHFLDVLHQTNKEMPVTFSLLIHLDLSTNMDIGKRREGTTVLCMLDILNGILRKATSPVQTIGARFEKYGATIDDFVVYERREAPPQKEASPLIYFRVSITQGATTEEVIISAGDAEAARTLITERLRNNEYRAINGAEPFTVGHIQAAALE